MKNAFWGVHGAISVAANPSLLLIGDSWFWHPIDNLANEIGAALSQQTLVVVGNNGYGAAQWSDQSCLPHISGRIAAELAGRRGRSTFDAIGRWRYVAKR